MQIVIERAEQQAADWLAKKQSPCVVMTCDDMSEAETVGQTLLKLNIGVLVTYRRACDLMLNAPAGRVAIVILATKDTPTVVRRTLRWLRHRWPHCPVTVLGDTGSGDLEMAAREGGASFLTRPVTCEEWLAVLSHTLAGHLKVEREPSTAQMSKAEFQTDNK